MRDALPALVRRSYVHPDVRGVAYRLAVWHSGEDAFRAVQTASRLVTDAAEHEMLLAALASGPTDALKRDALEMAVGDDSVRSQDVGEWVAAGVEGSRAAGGAAERRKVRQCGALDGTMRDDTT